jgi:hypothetical protein
MKNSNLQCKMPNKMLSAIFFFLPVFSINAQQPFSGKVVDAANGSPIESVRVTSSKYATTAYSAQNGAFTLQPGEEFPCRADSQIIFVEDGFTVSLSDQHGDQSRYTDKNVPLSLSLCDLNGRTVQRMTERSSAIAIAGNRLSSGVYVLAAGGFPARTILVSRNRIVASVSKSVRMKATTLPPTCHRNDTLYFCKYGYITAAYAKNGLAAGVPVTLRKKRWIASDLHNHSVLTDGMELQDTLCSIAFGRGGLDAYVNSEHGGSGRYSRDTAGASLVDQLGQAITRPRWFTLINYSWPKLLGQRKLYPDKLILQGLEWDCPGYEHASVGIISDAEQPQGIAYFDYMFGFNNYDISLRELPNYNDYLPENAMKGIEWLKAHYPATSYCFINHPSREAVGPYPIEAFRNFNTSAPEICFGFEGMPGHHKDPYRGGYGYIYNDRNGTWGGADYVLATVGGLWDALLGEGRHFYTIVDSDFHNRVKDFFPGEYAKTWIAVTDTGAQAWLAGMRTGDMFIAHGDLISTLEFSVDDGIYTAWMGSELHTAADSVSISIRFSSPLKNNYNDTPLVDHIDLIAGAITGTIDPSDPDYTNPVNKSAAVLHRFTASDWLTDPNGQHTINLSLPIGRSMYVRLRGTNLPVNTPGEVDASGNPMVDIDLMNTEAIAWNDLWFYSNPIFVYKK